MNKTLISLMFVLIFVLGSCGVEEVSCKIEGEDRIITCIEDSTKDQKQICSKGEWVNDGGCFLCESGETRIITCETDEKMEQEQTCYLGDWVDYGNCRCTYENKFCHSHDGLNWSDASKEIMYWYDAREYCEYHLEGRIPTISELRTLIQNCPETETGGECGVTDDCLYYGCSNACKGCEDDRSGKYSVFGDKRRMWSWSEVSDNEDHAWYVDFEGGTVAQINMYYDAYVRCVGSGDTGNTGDTGNSGDTGNTGDTGDTWVTDQTYAGLEWSPKSPTTKNWENAGTYCANMGGRLPTISELRTLIQNYPATETGGECGVTDYCLSYGDCWNESCYGCEWNEESDKYSVFGDTDWFWSSSEPSENSADAWSVGFYNAHVSCDGKGSNLHVRCVR